MAVRRDARNGQWRYRKRITLPDGRRVRLTGTPMVNTRTAAEDAERAHVERVLRGEPVKPPERKEVPKYDEWADQFLKLAAAKNKPSEVASKEMVLRMHLKPALGGLRLDAIGFAVVQDYVAARLAGELSKKTINNHLTVLRRSLVVAKKRGLIATVPEIEWLRAPKPDLDFLDFEEAERLVKAADGEWVTMMLVALRTGLRLGELLALRWDDVDLVKGQVHVRRSVTRGVITEPKSNRARVVPLSEETRRALKAHRHLRGELVFCTTAGRMFRKNETSIRSGGRAGRPGFAGGVRARPRVWPPRAERPRVALPAAQFRIAPRDAGRGVEGGAGPARSRNDRDDDAVRAPVAPRDARCSAVARRSAGQPVGNERGKGCKRLKEKWRRRESNTQT
jgi:site-specific recombinase XerD